MTTEQLLLEMQRSQREALLELSHLNRQIAKQLVAQNKPQSFWLTFSLSAMATLLLIVALSYLSH